MRSVPEDVEVPGLSFSLDVQPAEIALEESVRPAGRIRDLELLDGKAYVCGPWGLSVVGTEPGLHVASTVHGMETAGLTALEVCGSRLCGSRLRPRGLAVYEPDGESGVEFVGQAKQIISALGVEDLLDKVYITKEITPR